jgi:hypothetical protein
MTALTLLAIAVIAACYLAWRCDCAEKEIEQLRDDLAWARSGRAIKAAATKAAKRKALERDLLERLRA